MKNPIFTVMKKELARFFGDKRAAITTILLPGILIYALYSMMGAAISNNIFGSDDEILTAAAVNMPQSLSAIFSDSPVHINEISDTEAEAYKDKLTKDDSDNCYALIIFPENFDAAVADYSSADGIKAPNVEIFYNSSITNSQETYQIIEALLNNYESALTNKFDINNTETNYNLADDKDITGQIFSSMMPMLLLIFMFSGCMAVAPESLAGEKERGTMATMLITPVKRSHIALGKIAALSALALLSGISSTVGTMLSMPKLMGADANGIVTNVYGISEYLLLAVVILSTVLLLVTAVSVISAFAKSVKEAQGYVSPLMILCMAVGVTAMFGGGIKTDLAYYLIPLYNSVQCMTGIFSFNIVPEYFITAVAANIVYSGIGVFVLTKMFNSEKIIFTK